MPGSKHLMPGRAGRNIAGAFDIECDPLPAGKVAREPLMEPEADGVYAEGLRLGPTAVTSGLDANAGCQFYLVCTGTLIQDGKTLPPNSLIHAEPGEAASDLQAGPEGACVLALRFPSPSDRPGSNPSKLGARSESDYHMRPDVVDGAR